MPSRPPKPVYVSPQTLQRNRERREKQIEAMRKKVGVAPPPPVDPVAELRRKWMG